jgi:hypothetical protein
VTQSTKEVDGFTFTRVDEREWICRFDTRSHVEVYRPPNRGWHVVSLAPRLSPADATRFGLAIVAAGKLAEQLNEDR